MYAVFVIAAILLSASPMHARTLLAALPANVPGYQLAPEEQDQDQAPRVDRSHLPSAPRTQAHLGRVAHCPGASQFAAAPFPSPAIPAEATGLLEHAPNAP